MKSQWSYVLKPVPTSSLHFDIHNTGSWPGKLIHKEHQQIFIFFYQEPRGAYIRGRGWDYHDQQVQLKLVIVILERKKS